MPAAEPTDGRPQPVTPLPRFGRLALVFMVSVPLSWGILLLFHPNPTGNIHGGLHHHVTQWQVVHLGTLIGICLVGVVLQLLVHGLPGRAAAISRWAVLPYAVFYGAAEAIQGPATAVLVRYANGVPDADRPIAAGAVQALWDDVLVDDVLSAPGAVAWLVAVVAAAVAYHRAGAPWGVTVLLGAAAVAVIHTPPFGPFGLGCLAAAVAWLGSRQRAGSPAGALSTLELGKGR
jgi:hypothetical protein